MSVTTATLLALCLALLGCKRQQLDDDPTLWTRYAITVDQRAVTFSLPKGDRFGRDTLRSGVVTDQKPHTILYDAQYDYGRDGEIAEFEVLISVLKYTAPLDPKVSDMRVFEKALNEARAAAVPDPSQLAELKGEIAVLAGGRRWLRSSDAEGVTSYMTPLSETHALIVGVAYWKELKANKDWYRNRTQMFEKIVAGVDVIESGGGSPN